MEQPKDQMEMTEEFEHLPTTWFRKRYPEIAKVHGHAIDLTSKGSVWIIKGIREDFFAALLGEKGTPLSPTVYTTSRGFYTYDPEQGIYVPKSKQDLMVPISRLMQKCAEECKEKVLGMTCDTKPLLFQFSKASALNGIIEKAKGLLHVPESFFDIDAEQYIACKNGMLQLSDMTLLPFNPKYARRNKLAVSYDPDAKCPTFLDTLMRQALEDDDILLLQEWFGTALIGKNKPQVIVILVGTAGGGKSTFTDILQEIIGRNNVYLLRTEQLGGKFETSFYLGKTLLHGVDVKSDFLTQKYASVLKALTGGDTMDVEIKNNGTGGGKIEGSFNVIIICNSFPNVRLDGDAGAWKRRLIFVNYNKPKPTNAITSLADIILKNEGSGVLNWALIGLQRLMERDWKFILTHRQKELVDKVLLQSDSPKQFVERCLVKEDGCILTQADCFEAYCAFCKQFDWYPVPDAKIKIEQEILFRFNASVRHDLPNSSAKPQRGWKGIKVK